MGRQPLGRGRRIDRAAMTRAAREVFARLGVELDPGRVARGLSVADQQIVEIAKAISFDARVIVMDEPTAALTSVEVERLFDVIRTLRAQGAAVLFISHRLEEVFAICQRVTIMRDGRFVRTAPIEDVTIDDIIRSMVGRDLDALFPKTRDRPRRGRARGRAAHARGRLHRRLLQRAPGRDRRAGRSGRRRPQRGRPGDLRHRPPRRRHGPGARPGAAERLAAGGDGGRRRAGAGGPAPAGPGDGPGHRPERRARVAGRASSDSG